MRPYPPSALSVPVPERPLSERMAESLAPAREVLRRSAGSMTRREQGLAIAGLLLAQVLVVLLYMVITDNVTEVRNQRDLAETTAQERRRCTAMPERLEREQCLLTLQIGQMAVVSQR